MGTSFASGDGALCVGARHARTGVAQRQRAAAADATGETFVGKLLPIKAMKRTAEVIKAIIVEFWGYTAPPSP